MPKIRKTEIIVVVPLLLFYINKIFGFAEIPGFGIVNLIVFLTISIAGFKLYIAPEYKNKVKATLFAIFCGLAFSFGIIAFGAKVYNHQNIVVIVFGSLNFILFTTLIFLVLKSKKHKLTERTVYYKGLLIRSSVILTLCLILILLSFDFINIYLNRDNPVLHSRGLAEKYYEESIELTNQKKNEDGLSSAKKAFNFFKIGYENDSTQYYKAYEVLYNSYWKLILQNVRTGEDEKALEYIRLIKQPLHVWYGDSTREEASIKTIEGEIYQRKEKYKVADSLYIEALHLYKNYFKTKNLYYSLTLQLLANSYREQRYYNDAINLYKSVTYLLNKDTTNYTNSKDNQQPKNIINNAIASANAEIGWTYSLKQVYDSADIYFDKAFETKTYSAYQDYSKSLTKYAYFKLNKGDFHNSKVLMEKALNIVSEEYGENNYDYLYVLDGLNTVNTVLANYKEAEQGCDKALEILKKITSKKDNYFASLVLQLAYVKHHQGFYEIAEKYFKEALSYSNPESIQYADILDALSGLKCDLTKYSEAFDYAQQATTKASNYFEKDDSPHLTKYFRSEAYINYLIENEIQSEKLYLKCFAIDTINKIADKISYGATLNGLGLVKTRRKKYNEADTLYNATLKIYEKQIGKTHPDYATVLYNIAYLRLYENKLIESETLFSQSLNTIISTLGNKHDKVADNLTGLGEIKLKQKKVSEALDHFTKAYEIYKTKFKADHKKVILTAKYIDLCKNKK